MKLPVLNESSRTEREAIASDLRARLRGQVRFYDHDRRLYATDASLYQVTPIGVVIPADVDDAVAALTYCARRGIGVLPRGGGTSLAGQCVNHAVVIDLSPNCRALRSVDPDAQTCVVEPGVYVDELNAELLRRGHELFFAPDPATSRQATVGGCIGNNAAGARSVRYGRTSENLAGVELAMIGAHGAVSQAALRPAASGEQAVRLGREIAAITREHAPLIRERFPKTIRRNAGYGLDLILRQLDAGVPDEQLDLSGLVCGSEGTLGLVTSATLKLRPTPRARGLAVLGFESVEDAIDAVPALVESGATAVELLDDMVLSAANKNIEYRRYVDLLPRDSAGAEPKAVLYVERFGFGHAADDEVRAGFADAERIAAGRGIALHTDAGAMLNAWKLRKAGEPLLHGLSGKRKPVTFVEDNAVPLENLADFVAGFKEIVSRHGTRAAYWAHASVGVLHVRPMLDLHDEADRHAMREIAVEVADLARSVGGVMSGEHGDGRARGPLLERFFGPRLMDAFRRTKAAFDPNGLMNPGNIVSPGPIESLTESTRLNPDGPMLALPDIDTFFRYDDQEGFEGALEMCNGSGVCRKRKGGTMCPSYMGTMDERHSTRGRANALRLAVSGQASPNGRPAWDDPETHATLDLCLSCKACKGECPSNVDVARLKAEYTAQHFRQRGGPTFKARAFGAIRRLNRIASLTPGLANATGALAPVRGLMRRTLGIDPRRSLPRFERSLYARLKPRDTDAPRVILFADCFTTFNEPRIGMAAARAIRALGFEPVLSAKGSLLEGGGCCARSMISMGNVAAAAQEIERTVELLRDQIQATGAESIVVCEPSCLSAITDDWPLVRSTADPDWIGRIVAMAVSPETFVARELTKREREAPAPTDAAEIVLHAHCHQKALTGSDDTEDALRLATGRPVRTLDAGCCGMAGSFGFDHDKFDLSMAIGELTLLPEARRLKRSGGTLCATGTSCRHQVHDGAAMDVPHPIELIADALEVRTSNAAKDGSEARA